MKPQEFAKKTTRAYKKGLGIFSNKVNAEEMVPNCSKKERSLFLFYVIQPDYATKSQRLYKGARKLFEKDRNFFKPNYILSLSNKKLENYLKDYLKPRYLNEAKRRFRKNSSILIGKYDGDPRKIFEGSNSAKLALKKVGEFRGFGPKIGNFLVRTMINSFKYSYDDVEDLLPPVDVHDVRIAFLMGYIGSDKMTQKNILETKNLWSNACKKAGVSWLTFDKALWLLGSEGKPKDRDAVLDLISG